MKNVELAKAMGVSPVTVSRWVTNQQQPTLEMLGRIAEVLQVDICQLIDHAQPITPAQEPS